MERANATLQDRLVKEMRLQGISGMAAGNAFLPAFMAAYNARFAKPPFDDRICIGSLPSMTIWTTPSPGRRNDQFL